MLPYWNEFCQTLLNSSNMVAMTIHTKCENNPYLKIFFYQNWNQFCLPDVKKPTGRPWSSSKRQRKWKWSALQKCGNKHGSTSRRTRARWRKPSPARRTIQLGWLLVWRNLKSFTSRRRNGWSLIQWPRDATMHRENFWRAWGNIPSHR